MRMDLAHDHPLAKGIASFRICKNICKNTCNRCKSTPGPLTSARGATTDDLGDAIGMRHDTHNGVTASSRALNITPAGDTKRCIRCEQDRSAMQYACLPCARRLAKQSDAPNLLTSTLATIDHQIAAAGRQA